MKGKKRFNKQEGIFTILTGLLLAGCNPFHEDRVLSYETELNNVVSEVQREHIDVSWFDSDDIPEIIDLDADVVIRNITNKNNQFSGFIEESDSVIILIQKSSSILDTEKRIIYDFAKKPRNFGNNTIKGASYNVVQLNDRWYFSTEGFD